MHRLPIFQDTRSFDERTERMLRDVRRQIDEDLQNFGFGRKKLLTTSRLRDKLEEDAEGGLASSLLSHDFFQLRPSSSAVSTSLGADLGGSSSRLSSPPLASSRESLDDETTKRLYVERSPSDGGRLFCMSFDVKDYEAEDISVTVEDDTLLVQAKNKSERDGAVSIKEFNRKIKLPKDVDPERLSSTLTSDGILTIEAQVPPEYADCTPLSTPISSPPPLLSGDASPLSQNGNFRPRDGDSATASSQLQQQRSEASSPPNIPLDTPVFSNDDQDRRRMELVLNVGSPYGPEDLTVKLEGKKLIVEATHVDKWQGRTSKVSMQRDFDLAEDIDVSSVKALMRKGGQLTITASVK